MTTWPFTHNWTTTYNQTWSFNTVVLTSQSGLEQRVAQRFEPRRTINTTLLEDRRSAQMFDRFLWTQQASLFSHVDPVTGYVSSVRLDDTQQVTHPASGVAVASIALSVDPGSDMFGATLEAYVVDDYASDGYILDGSSQVLVTTPPDDALYAFAGRQVFPFPVNWTAGRADVFTLPRRVADFGGGVVSVSRPINFATRTGSVLLLRVGRDETDALTGFFCAAYGRQRDFWAESLLDDMDVVEIVSNTLEVAGADAAAMFNADSVSAAIALYSYSGAVYRRRVLSAEPSGDTTFLQLDYDVPEQPVAWRRCSWLRVSRFASDDLTIQWTTNTVAQAQVQVQTLPYSDAEQPLATSAVFDYYGAAAFTVADPLDIAVNVETPLAGTWP